MTELHKELPDVTSPRVLRELFAARNLSPHRRWGQNFLIDANLVRKIVAALDLQGGDQVLEVGPGAGALTASLASKAEKLVAFEIDRGLVELLRHLFQGYENVQILNCDALEIDWAGLQADYFPGNKHLKLISNLPYVISSPFMYNLFRNRFPLTRAVLMFQKEVAERLTAQAGDPNYGALSVLSAYYCSGEILFSVSSNVFWPRPKVGSSVLLLQPREPLLNPEEEKHFSGMVQGLFQQRRKTLLNNMTNYYNIERQTASKLLEEAGLPVAERPENISLEQFALLARIIYNYHK